MIQSEPKTILILAANPRGTSALRLDREVREINNGLRQSLYRHQFQLEQRWALRSRDVQRALLDVNPHIVHFCGHGEGQSGLVLEDKLGDVKLVSTEALSQLFELFADRIECVLLNACYAAVQADAIVQHINYVIGMRQAVPDDLAIAFSVGFYQALAARQSIEAAFQSGCDRIQQVTSAGASDTASDSPSDTARADRKLIPIEFADGVELAWPDRMIPILRTKELV
jgi:hypothetical protein